ncbi:MAG: plastocyanin/azurin family copper-binding protein [Halobacteriaceae archaeon]
MRTTRRRVLTVAGSTALVALAGCGSGGSDTDTTTTETTHHETTTGHHDGGDHHETTTDHHDGTTTGDHAHHQHHDGHHHEKIPHEPADHVEVKMVTTDSGGDHFAPHLAWVKPGGTVTFHNESGSHTSTAYAPENDRPRRIPADAESWDSGLLTEQGATFEHTFEVEGVYDYYCTPHEQFGMVGTVLVGRPDLHHQPGMEPPAESIPSAARQKITDLNGMVERALGHHEE